MATSQSRRQVLNWLTPVVFFCAFNSGENTVCNGQTALYKHELPPSNTPMNCLMDGWVDAAHEITEFHTEHPNKDLEFRVVCKHEKV